MINLKKIVLFLISVFIITGCGVDYRVTITSNKKFIEEINIVVDRDAYSPNKDQAERDIKQEIGDYRFFPEYQPYDIVYNIYDNRIEFQITGTHDDFASYQKSPFIQQIVPKIALLEDQFYELFTYQELYDINKGLNSDSKFYIKDFQIAVRAHNKINSSNAHKEDTSKNILFWYPLEEETEAIKIDLEYGKRYDIILMDIITKYYLYIIISGVILIGGAIIFLGQVINYRLKNKI